MKGLKKAFNVQSWEVFTMQRDVRSKNLSGGPEDVLTWEVFTKGGLTVFMFTTDNVVDGSTDVSLFLPLPADK